MSGRCLMAPIYCCVLKAKSRGPSSAPLSSLPYNPAPNKSPVSSGEPRLLQCELETVALFPHHARRVVHSRGISVVILTGKTITLARTMDIPRSVQNFRFFASSVLHHTSECTQMDHLGCMHYTVREPVGIGGCRGPGRVQFCLELP